MTEDRRQYLSPAELCDRWGIDRRTLDKLLGPQLPVLKVTARVWRIKLTDVETYERTQHLTPLRSISPDTV